MAFLPVEAYLWPLRPTVMGSTESNVASPSTTQEKALSCHLERNKTYYDVIPFSYSDPQITIMRWSQCAKK